MIRILAIALLSLGAVAPPCLAETLRIATEAGYPPYVMRDAHGRLTGLDKDLGDAVCAALQADCIWTDAPFDSLIPDLAAGRYDLVIGGIAATPERRASVDFSRGYMASGANVAVYAALSLTPGLRPANARIGVQDGTIQADHLRQAGRDLRAYPTLDAAWAALARREVDMVMTSDMALRAAQETGHPGLRAIAEEEIAGWPTAIAIRPGAEDLRARVDAALLVIQAEGLLTRLVSRWFAPGTAT